jgi:hypothetical protein
MNVPSKSELMHLRLQAWMREWNCGDIEYLGVKNYNGTPEHFYKIDTHEVPVCNIEDFEQV